LKVRTILLKKSKKIGLLADSHGNLKSISTGIERLTEFRVHALIHLGDIFDSMQNDDLHGIFEMLIRNNILTVKGNNDFQVENLLANGHPFGMSPEKKDKILSFLKSMPMRLVDENICYAHSLPFNSIRSFYEPVDTGSTDRAGQIFEKTPYKIIFCGHSHSSVMFQWSAGRVTREIISPDELFFFNPSHRYIIIIGSSDNGEYGIFDKGRMTYRRICINV